MIDTAIYQILGADTGVLALVGAEIYIGINPNPGNLYITIQQVRHSRPANIDNSLSQQQALFQVDIYGKSSPAVSTLGEAVVSAVHYQAANADGHDIQLMRVDNERSDYESTEKLFRKSLDISVFFN